jgi:hypothetical protein
MEDQNSKVRRAVRAKGHFPADEAATKRTMSAPGWSVAKIQFAILIDDGFTKTMKRRCSTLRPETESLIVPGKVAKRGENDKIGGRARSL